MHVSMTDYVSTGKRIRSPAQGNMLVPGGWCGLYGRKRKVLSREDPCGRVKSAEQGGIGKLSAELARACTLGKCWFWGRGVAGDGRWAMGLGPD